MKFIAVDLDDTLYKEVDFVKSAFRAVAAEFSCAFDVYCLLWNSYRNGENPFDNLIAKEPDM